MAKTRVCSTKNCNGDSHTLEMCLNCYQRARYWHEKTLKEKVTHLKRLGIRRNLMNEIISMVVPGKAKRSKSA